MKIQDALSVYKGFAVFTVDGELMATPRNVDDLLEDLRNGEDCRISASIDGFCDYSDITEKAAELYLADEGIYEPEGETIEDVQRNIHIPAYVLEYMENNGWHAYDDGGSNADYLYDTSREDAA